MSQTYTLEEVSKHNNDKDCWVAIDGQVYDITKFLAFHPAGKNVILQVAGKDVSEVFHQFHPKTVILKYQKFVIGQLTSSDVFQKKAPLLQYANAQGSGIPHGDPYSIQGQHSPYYNETHFAFRKALRAFIEKEYVPFIDQWDEAYNLPKEAIQKAAKEGIFLLTVGKPFAQGFRDNNIFCGVEIPNPDTFHELIVYEEFGRVGSGGLIWGLFGGISIGVPPIMKFADKQLQDRYAKQLLRGEKIACLAITEPYVGSDVASLQTTATLSDCGNFYIVNGMKKFITNGVFADCFTVAVRTGGKAHAGISMIVCDRSMQGITTRKMKMQGVWSSGTTFIIFDNVKVPKENIIGKVGSGFSYIMQNFNHERFSLVCQSLGLARCAYEESMRFAHTRKTFGKKLIEHPVIRNKLAHMIRQIESLQALTEQLCYNIDKMDKKQQTIHLSGIIAIAKAHANLVLENVTNDAIQVLGGQGYTRGALGGKVERLFRDAKAMTQGGGTPEILLDLGARQASKLMPSL